MQPSYGKARTIMMLMALIWEPASSQKKREVAWIKVSHRMGPRRGRLTRPIKTECEPR